MKGGYYHAGQVCVSTQRIYVHDAIVNDFTERLVARVKKLRTGDPTLKDTEVGPLITPKEADRAASWIEVRDAGPGIAAHNLPRLFEPFFTTNAKGTGLGLYLARELCEANRAQLQYIALPTPGCCFRISGVGHVVEEGA